MIFTSVSYTLADHMQTLTPIFLCWSQQDFKKDIFYYKDEQSLAKPSAAFSYPLSLNSQFDAIQK